MDSREATNSTPKLAKHQSDVDDMPGMLYKPVEVVRTNTRQEVCIFIFIGFCLLFEARSAYISLQTYYRHERPVAVTRIPHPWPDRPNGVLNLPSEAAYGYNEGFDKRRGRSGVSIERGGCGMETRVYQPPLPHRRVPLTCKFHVVSIFSTSPPQRSACSSPFFNSKPHLDSWVNPTSMQNFSISASAIPFAALAHKYTGGS